VDFDEMGVVRLKEDGDFVEHHYKFAWVKQQEQRHD
jgi:hypothetical protein